MSRARAVLTTSSVAHFVHDGFSDIVYVFLPLWAREFGLSFAQVGVIRTAYTGAMAAFQIPAGLLAERWGERRVLVAGTVATALGFLVAGQAGGFGGLLALLLLAGLGSGVQHPLSSSLVSAAYETGPRRTALGTYNFAGDLGKIAASAAVGLAVTIVGWRGAAAGYAVIGLAAAVAIAGVLARLGAGTVPPPRDAEDPRPSGWGVRDPRGFSALAAIGMVDNATRTAFLTFLPFILIAKGSTPAGVGLALALVFAGGAAGKFVCGVIAERLGIIRTVIATETATTLGILAILAAPLPVALAILLPVGVALNGTSSVLYATVADLITPDRRSRSYALYYTLSMGASAAAPTLYGLLGDAVGPATTMAVIALVVLVTVPLCLVLRSAVAAPAQAQL